MKFIKTRNLIWQLPLLLVLSYPIWWDHAARLLSPKKEFIHSWIPAEKSFVMEGVSFVQNRDGQAEFLMSSDKVVSRNNQTILNFDKVDAQLLDPKDRVLVKGNEAIYDSEKQILTMLGDVQIDSDSGKSLKTPVIRYLAKYKKIKSAAELNFTSQNMTISGNSFFYDLNNGNFRVGSRVIFTML